MHGIMYLVLLVPFLATVFCQDTEADKTANKLASILIDSVKKNANKGPEGVPDLDADDEEIEMLDTKDLNDLGPGLDSADMDGGLEKKARSCSYKVKWCYTYGYTYYGSRRYRRKSWYICWIKHC